MDVADDDGLVGRYLELGLRLGRHLDGFVDAYYGPTAVALRVEGEPLQPPAALLADARRLLADLDAGAGPALQDSRRRWLRAQALGLLVSARRFNGEPLGYVDEVEGSYGVTPKAVPEDAIVDAHRRLDAALPGTGPLRERYQAWRDSHAVAPELLHSAIGSLVEDLRQRTDQAFGLPDGEHVEFELVTDRPWSGFNHYLGGLRSRVSINVDLPVLSTSLGHLVAHEAYPGHHTEHARKEVGLVRRRGWQEESIFLVGTPQCVLAEGLADLGLEVLLGERPESVLAAHFHPLGIRYDADVVVEVAAATEVLSAVRGNLALLLHEAGRPAEEVAEVAQRWMLVSPERAKQAVRFLTDPTWRAYISCYVEGLPLCRSFVAGNPQRFERLLTEQLVPADLVAA